MLIDAADVSPLQLPQWPLEQTHIALHNRLHLRREPWQGRVMGESLRVQWGSDEATSASDHLHLPCALGAARFSLSVPRSLAPAAITGPMDLASSLLIEHSWLALIEPLEALFQLPLRVLPSVPFDTPLQLDLVLQVGDTPLQSACLHMDAASATLIVDVLDRCCPPTPSAFDTLPVAARLNAGDAPLTVAQWRSLRPGDVVMLDQAADAHPSLVIGGCLQTSVQIDGSRVRLHQAPFPLNRNHSMSTPDATDGTLDSLPLTLVCQLGSHELSLAQLREMGPGSILALATDGERVDLMINGRRVGQGELVRIGSGLGVRVSSLATS